MPDIPVSNNISNKTLPVKYLSKNKLQPGGQVSDKRKIALPPAPNFRPSSTSGGSLVEAPCIFLNLELDRKPQLKCRF